MTSERKGKSRANLNETEFEAEIARRGNSLAVSVTSQARRMGLDAGDRVRVRLMRIPEPPKPEGGWPRYLCTTYDGEELEFEVRPKGSRYSIYSQDDPKGIGDFVTLEAAMAFVEGAYPDFKRIQ